MRFCEDAIKGLIAAIGYTPQDGKNGIYCKSYSNHGGYCIFIDFNAQQIIYDSDENPSGIAIKYGKEQPAIFRKQKTLLFWSAWIAYWKRAMLQLVLSWRKPIPLDMVVRENLIF